MELIPLRVQDGITTVSARDLHTFLKAKSEFANWFKYRVQQYDFVEGKDFLRNLSKSTFGRPSVQFYITIDMAYELAMIENNEQGRTARKYFLQCKKELDSVKRLSSVPQTYKESVALLIKKEELLIASLKKVYALTETVENQTKLIEEQSPKAEFYDRVIEVDTSWDMRRVAAMLNIKGIGRNKLFKILQGMKILDHANVPYRNFIDSGLFLVRQINIQRDLDKPAILKTQTRVTQKGLDFIQRRVFEYVENNKEVENVQ